MVENVDHTRSPYVIFSCIGPVDKAKLFSSLRLFPNGSIPIVITSRKFVETWDAEGVISFKTKFNAIAGYKVLVRSLFVRLKYFRRGWLWLSNSRLLGEYAHFWMQPHTSRHFEALRLLQSLDPNSWAFLAGSRDLVFQTSPREVAANLAKEGSLHFFDEAGRYFKDGEIQVTKNSDANLGWAKQILNNDPTRLSEISDEVIINSDCIFGKVSMLKAFLEKSCLMLSKSEYSAFALLDQASTNFVAHDMMKLEMAKCHINGSVVLNMCGVIDKNVDLNDGKLYLEGRVIPIVHQFDRFGTWTPSHGLTLDKRPYKVQ